MNRQGSIFLACCRTLFGFDDYQIQEEAMSNPSRRFDQATIGVLLGVRWWDWDIEKITRNVGAICGDRLEALQAAQ